MWKLRLKFLSKDNEATDNDRYNNFSNRHLCTGKLKFKLFLFQITLISYWRVNILPRLIMFILLWQTDWYEVNSCVSWHSVLLAFCYIGNTYSLLSVTFVYTVPITLTVHPLKRKNVRRKENTRETNKPQKEKRKLNTEKQDETARRTYKTKYSFLSFSLFRLVITLLFYYGYSLSLFRF